MSGDDRPWSDSGYVVEIPYTKQYIRHQSPIALSFAAAANGFTPPDPRAPFSYCDLGCAEAVTLLSLAAAYPQSRFVGVDLNPDHIKNASDLAQRARLDNLSFFVGTFAQFAASTPERFDYIAAHGVYSWVSPAVVETLLQVVEQTLKDGGLFYFCHYVRPKGTRTEFLFHLLQTLMAQMSGPLAGRIRAAVSEAQVLAQEGGPLAQDHPYLQDDLNGLANRDTRYLVHEFCNKYFRPNFFREVAQDLRDIGLGYVGSARAERNNPLNLYPMDDFSAWDGLPFVAKEDRASLLGDDEFRWDVFQKGATEPSAQSTALNGYKLVSAKFPCGYPKEATLWSRTVSFDTPVFKTLLEGGHAGTKDIGDLVNGCVDRKQARETVLDMVASGMFQPLIQAARSPIGRGSVSYEFSHALSKQLFERDFYTEGSCSFSSAIMGSALVFSGFNALATYAMDTRDVDIALAWTRTRLRAMTAQGRRKIGVKFKMTDDAFIERETNFKRAVLPRLLKYEILTPIG